MIRSVVFCPAAPVLIPDLAQGAAGELDDLRAACRAAIRASAGRRWMVLGPGETSRSFGVNSRGTFAGYGLPLELGLGSDEPGPVDLPPSLTVGAWLLRDALGPGCDASGWSVGDAFDRALEGWDADVWDDDSDYAVLALGDGSARRSVKAPGYFSERADPFDTIVANALASGGGDRLHGLYDADEDLLQTGTGVWELLARSLEGPKWRAELLYDEAPYGVGYFVASWFPDA